ncbi:MAG: hypothetical protein GY950_36120 [bacterium]|nr:hypothetical protein [bacterium]
MRKIFIISLCFALFTGIGLNTGCKKSEDTTEFSLTVTSGAGVEGTPGSGVYAHTKDEQVAYDYTLKENYIDLKVTLDAVDVEPNGTVTMADNHILIAQAEPNPDAFSLAVSLAAGVEGSPASGLHYHLPGTQVAYNYTLKDNYQDLEVKLDDVVIPSSGTITITKDQIMVVTATLHYDITGSWTLREAYLDDSLFEVTVTFTGDDTSGTVADSDGGTGTYTVDGTYVVFNLDYPEISYAYTGFFTEENDMGGSATRTITGGESHTGSWAATRNATTIGQKASSRNNNKGYLF